MRRVSMELSERDVRRAEELTEQWHTASKADTVSVALTLAHQIVTTAGNRGEVIVKDVNGGAVKLRLDAVLG